MSKKIVISIFNKDLVFIHSFVYDGFAEGHLRGIVINDVYVADYSDQIEG